MKNFFVTGFHSFYFLRKKTFCYNSRFVVNAAKICKKNIIQYKICILQFFALSLWLYKQLRYTIGYISKGLRKKFKKQNWHSIKRIEFQINYVIFYNFKYDLSISVFKFFSYNFKHHIVIVLLKNVKFNYFFVICFIFNFGMEKYRHGLFSRSTGCMLLAIPFNMYKSLPTIVSFLFI